MPRATLWQIYLLTVCLVSLIAIGIAGSAALLGSLQLHYPQLMLSTKDWETVATFDGYVVSLPQHDRTTSDTAALLRGWQQHRRHVLKRERHLGTRRAVWFSVTMLVAFAIFLPHWWAARRLARREAGKPRSD
jgi:hypothetical protein